MPPRKKSSDYDDDDAPVKAPETPATPAPVSADATHSTYAEVESPEGAGRQVEQTPGPPKSSD